MYSGKVGFVIGGEIYPAVSRRARRAACELRPDHAHFARHVRVAEVSPLLRRARPETTAARESLEAHRANQLLSRRAVHELPRTEAVDRELEARLHLWCARASRACVAGRLH